MKTAALVLLGTMTLGACNTPPKDPPAEVPVGTGAASATATPPVPSPGPTAAPTAAPTVTATASAAPSASTKPATTGKGCTSDAECRTWSSYCAEAPCACRVLAKSEGDPKCAGSGPKVNCFADPCLNKAARCQSGACVLTAKGATEK